MSVVEDTRRLMQDIVAPELKAIKLGFKQSEKSVNLRFDHTEQRFEQIDRRFEKFENTISQRFETDEKFAATRYEAVLAPIDNAVSVAVANRISILRAPDMERPMERIESTLASRESPGLHSGNRSPLP